MIDLKDNHNHRKIPVMYRFFISSPFFQLDLQASAETGDTSTFVLNGEWALLGMTIITCFV